MRVWSIAGNSQALDGGAMFGNAPKALWQQWLPADANNRVPLACRCLLVDGIAGGKRVLFETGIGAFFEPKLRTRYGVIESEHVLLHSLQTAGFDQQDIDVVVLSHLHFDHAGGLLAAWREGQAPRLLFPNARFLVSRAGFERACRPHARDRASYISELPKLLQQSGRLELVDATHSETLGAEVTFEFSDGHSPGLMLSTVGGAGGMAYCADLIPGRPWVHVPITMGYDRYPELLIDEKQRFLADKLDRSIRLFFTHDPACASASVMQDHSGRYTTTDPKTELRGETLFG